MSKDRTTKPGGWEEDPRAERRDELTPTEHLSVVQDGSVVEGDRASYPTVPGGGSNRVSGGRGSARAYVGIRTVQPGETPKDTLSAVKIDGAIEVEARTAGTEPSLLRRASSLPPPRLATTMPPARLEAQGPPSGIRTRPRLAGVGVDRWLMLTVVGVVIGLGVLFGILATKLVRSAQPSASPAPGNSQSADGAPSGARAPVGSFEEAAPRNQPTAPQEAAPRNQPTAPQEAAPRAQPTAPQEAAPRAQPTAPQEAAPRAQPTPPQEAERPPSSGSNNETWLK